MFGFAADSARFERLQDTGLLLLRVGAGGLLALGHGWPKLAGFSAKSATFSDPIGIGSAPTLTFAVFAELLCAALLVPGFHTRLAALPPAITMLVAGLVVHASDPFARKEKAFLYLVMFLAVACAGPGRYSVDHMFRRSR